MSLVTVNYFSTSLGREVSFQALLPIDRPMLPGQVQQDLIMPLKSFYLLNGYSGSCNDWISFTNIRELADQNQIAVFMPSGENSFYCDDEAKGELFGEYIGNELVEFTRKMFPISSARKDTFIGGLSMGGYGAIRNGLKYHEKFSKIIALSSALIFYKIANKGPDYHDGVAGYPYFNRVFGNLNEILGSDKDPEAIIRSLRDKGAAIPEIYMACGDDEFLLDVNIRFHQYLVDQGISHMYEQSEGAHTWDFWRRTISTALLWALKESSIE